MSAEPALLNNRTANHDRTEVRMIAMLNPDINCCQKGAEHADNPEQQDSTELTIGEHTMKLRNPWSDCKNEVLAGPGGEIYLLCTGSARVYEMTGEVYVRGS